MKRLTGYILISAVLLLSAAFSLSAKLGIRKINRKLSVVSVCGRGPDTARSSMRNRDCHSPVTSYVDKLPPPAIMRGVGISHLTVTTRSDSAQKYFDQGLSLLHDFWEFEAYRAFKRAAQLDSTLAMAHWGIAFSLNGNSLREKEYKNALEKAKKFSGAASEHERLYIKALAAKDSVDKDGDEAFRTGMEKIISKYPEDPEAKLILWLRSLDSGYSGEDPNKDALYAQFMLEKLLLTHPNHPAVHHYWIHQMEDCCPQSAVASADRLAGLTPLSGHMVHMPGHIYYRVGDYKKARAAFIASMKVDSAYMAGQHIEQLDNWNYPHNLHYLIVNCTEEGKYGEALYWHKRLEEIPPPVDSVKDRLDEYRNFAFARKVWFGSDLEIRFGLWQKVVDRYSRLSDSDSLFASDESHLVYKNVLLEYARGMQAIESKNYDKAKSAADALDALLWRSIKQDKIDVWEIREQRFNVQSLELRGNLLSATGDYDGALELLEQAQEIEKKMEYSEPPPYSRPVAESIAQAHIRAGEYKKAREAYEGMLRLRPNSGFALFGIARTYELAGNKADATNYYKRFKQVWDEADPTLPQVKKADQWLRTNLK